MDRGAWRVTVHGVAKNQTQLSNLTTTTKVKYKKAMGLNKFPTEFQNHIFSGLLTILVEFLTCFCYCSATQSCQTLCDLIHSSTPGFPAL